MTEMLVIMDRIDPGFHRQHLSILRSFPSTGARRRFLREVITDVIFARAQRQSWALRAAVEVARLERYADQLP